MRISWILCILLPLGLENVEGTLVIAVDKSGSMADDNKLTKVKEVLKNWLVHTAPQDGEVGLLAFNESTHSQYGFDLSKLHTLNRTEIAKQIDKIEALGGTCYGKAMFDAEGLLGGESGGKILVIGDGKLECTDDISMDEIANRAIKNKQTIYTINVGNELDKAIESASRKTGGINFKLDIDFSAFEMEEQINEVFEGGKTIHIYDENSDDRSSRSVQGQSEGCKKYELLNHFRYRKSGHADDLGRSYCDNQHQVIMKTNDVDFHPSPDWKGEGWYRFDTFNGRMPENAPGGDKCGTSLAGWVKGSHPSNGATKDVEICFSDDSTDCVTSVTAKISECSGHYVYYLKELTCMQRYCVE